ncbi:uncharacterized protein HD556DRAFT_1230269 [Suillus plorans]|uniref:non-specific serine/threonine protein kinase n=1 Tax=Suillus plorans TaxID=116603 RepID=A0A9P7J2V5_9AGAM|nr:uncharacterized protein HD556DRAFT_1230269 [Suillus plorans]KAG1800449.1 hypothetical protein HD556DRAFT_1230269 [Suillus plorans]
MPGVAATFHQRGASKKNFKSVLGFGSFNRSRSSVDSYLPRQPTSRVSIDTTRSFQYKRKSRQERASATDASSDSLSSSPHAHQEHSQNHKHDPNNTVRSMKSIDAAHTRPLRRPPVRIDAQEGPWSVSVAETPHDVHSYSIYIKTSTHNLTLTRTATEVVELHGKLADSVPGTRLPKLPIDLAAQPIKRNIFLNTLSRLASPSNKVARTVSTRIASASSITPIVSPTHEIGDPFTETGGTGSGGNVVTSLAAYLTTISNEPTFRQTRAWKRFVRVRTDDLESVRVERAIKRVRSDLAAHGSSNITTNVSSGNVSEIEVDDTNGATSEVNLNDFAAGDLREEGIKEEEEDVESIPVQVEALAPVADEAPLTEAPEDIVVVDEAVPTPIEAELAVPNAADGEETAVSTPVAEVQASRILRSHSADPDKASRLSRAYTSSTLQEGTSSQTGDDSSISTNTGGRKNRTKSADPNKELKKRSKRKVVIDDFEMMRVLGKGCAGKVLLVKHKTSSDLYALKAITKRHVLAHQELQHTLTEQAVLKRMAAESKDPFVVKLWWSFHDKENLFLVMDFHPGGDLATQLARWGRLGRDRARFYAAEIVEGVEGLHAAGVIYRDLKPENILIGADGHIVLTDFGLSKEFPRRVAATTAPPTPTRGEFYSAPGSEPATPPWMKGEKSQDVVMGWHGQTVGPMDATTTFCGTAEYLAPEVIQGLPYSYEVDWWSFGTMLYEMLTGITPFWANNHSDMYVRVLQDELQFPEDRAIDQDTKSLIRGLLQRNPALRMCEPRIKRHPYFSMIDWSHVYYKRYIPPYIPPIDPSNASDTQNFDDTFLDMEPVIDDPNDQEQTDTDRDQTDAEPTDGEGEDSSTTPSHSRSPSVHPIDESVDVFDGYSFKGRHSVILDDDDDEVSGESEREETDEEEVPEILSNIADTPLQPKVEEASPVVDETTPEPKTPEARPQVLPEEQPAEIIVQPQEETTTLVEEPSTPVEPITPSEPSSAPLKESPLPTTPTSPPQEIVPIPPAKDVKQKVTKPTAPRPSAHRSTRNRREKSGVPALDRFLSDGPDEEECTEKEEEEDWDFIEAGDGEDRNGTKGTSLFARGVVDRYRLAVFRKASTPSQRMGGRSFSGMSKESDVHGTDPAESPSPSEKHRRGRAPALKFRKTPRQFLRAKSPPSSFPTTKSSSTAKTLTPSTSATLSSVSSGGLLSPSVSGTSPTPMSPSLKSKESATSVGESLSSDQSNGDTIPETLFSPESTRGVPAAHTEEPEKLKTKKLKKYKEGAEKMLSLFASPRQ